MRLTRTHAIMDGEPAERLGRDPTTILHHVRELVDAGLLDPPVGDHTAGEPLERLMDAVRGLPFSGKGTYPLKRCFGPAPAWS
ncbi:hypothetical protein GCM10010433_68360 [Streptomyces pulveraceus]